MPKKDSFTFVFSVKINGIQTKKVWKKMVWNNKIKATVM